MLSSLPERHHEIYRLVKFAQPLSTHAIADYLGLDLADVRLAVDEMVAGGLLFPYQTGYGTEPGERRDLL